jgi:hypothetical protein
VACLLQIDADPVPDPAYHFDADPGYQNDADPDPQQCLEEYRTGNGLKRNISGELPIRLLLEDQWIIQRKISDITSLGLNSIRLVIAALAPFCLPQT